MEDFSMSDIGADIQDIMRELKHKSEFRKEVNRRLELGEEMSLKLLAEADNVAMMNTFKFIITTELDEIRAFDADKTLSKEEKAEIRNEWLDEAERRIKLIAELNTDPEFVDVAKELKMTNLELAYSVKRAIEAVEV
jgi:hypothetical protein